MNFPSSPHLAALSLVTALAAASPAHADTVDAAALAQVATLASGAAAAGASAGARIEVLPGTLDPRLRLAPCARVQPYLPPGAAAWGRTRVGLRCVEGATLWNVFLPVTVRVWAPAQVATSDLPAGTVLAQEHLQRAEIDWAASPQPAFVDVGALVGRTLARPLAAGGAPRHNDIRLRQWFAAGDTVQVLARGNGFAIRSEARALSNGVEGQPARVRTEAGRVLTGQPTGERLMEVAL